VVRLLPLRLGGALVFNKLFFPEADPLTGTLLAFATSATGFVARPIGGIVFCHYGDKVGRKTVLVVTLLVMGVATFLIGLLPTYAVIGVAAPILLVVLRFVQGLGLGGEWGGAVLMSLEHGEPDRRGWNASWPQVGVPAGNLLAAGVLAVMSVILSDAAFESWGWRVPFLLSGALIAVGLWIRMTIAEFPLFQELERDDTGVRYSGASLGYQIAGVLGGALAPIISIALLDRFGSALPVSLYVLGGLLITIVSVWLAPETAKTDLHQEPAWT
jgi:MFS family permease